MKRMVIGCAVLGILALVVVWMRRVDAQPQGPPPGPPELKPLLPPGTPFFQPEIKPVGGVVPVPFEAKPTPPAAPEPTIYDLLTKLRTIRAQQAELAKKEAETMGLLKKELTQLTEDSKKLGITIEEVSKQVQFDPDRVKPAP